MLLKSAACTDVGLRRRADGDAFGAPADRGVFVVADGLGGHVAGRRASDTATAMFVSSLALAGEKPPADAVRQALQCANTAIFATGRRDPKLRGMATTLVSLWIRGDHATLAHIGDSRIYVVRDGKLHLLTMDHSVVRDLVARGELSEEAAAAHPQRHVITRALGVAAEPDPDIANIQVREGDVYMLCSDGISGQLSDEEMLELIASNRGDLDEAARQLIQAANDRGGEDNATVVLVSATS